MPKRILILGAGTGGTLLANSMGNRLAGKIRSGAISVELIAENDRHVFQPANLDIAFRGANPNKSTKRESVLVNGRVKLILDGATSINLEKNLVTTKSGAKLDYEYLVISTGSVAFPEGLEGLSEGSLNFHTGPDDSAKIWNALKDFRSGTIVVAIAGVPHKCPPSPIEAALLLDELLRKRGIRKDTVIKLITPYARAYPAAPIADVVEPLFKKRDIEVMSFFNVSHVEPKIKKIYSLEGEEASYDLLIAVPPHRGADIIINSRIGDRDGWVPTDKNTMNVKGYNNAFAIGDATDIPISKSGVVAHLEAEVVAENIISLLSNSDDKFAYNGRINCPMELGNRKGLFVSATYSTPVQHQTPSTIKYIMKKSFGKLYWVTLSARFGFIFDRYFGKTRFRIKMVKH